MSTKISLALIFLIITAMGLGFYSCENSINTPTYRGMIKGWVYDDLTKVPITGVWIFSDEIRDTTYTDDSGRFIFESINMPKSEYTYNLIFQRNGYISKSLTFNIKSDELFVVDSVFMMKVNK